MALDGRIRPYSNQIGVVPAVLDTLASFGAAWLTYAFWSVDPNNTAAVDLPIVLVGAFLVIFFLWVFGAYGSWRAKSFFEESGIIFFGIFLSALVLSFLGYLSFPEVVLPRKWAASWFTAIFLFTILWRACARLVLRELRKLGFNSRKAVVIGDGDLRDEVVASLRSRSGDGVNTVGVFSYVPEGAPALQISYPGLVTGGSREFVEFVLSGPVDQAWLCISLRNQDRLEELIRLLRGTGTEIRFVPDQFTSELLQCDFRIVAGLPAICVSDSPRCGMARILKGTVDRGLALVALVLLAPLLFIIAIGIKLTSPGPILFKQLRGGWNSREFCLWKFRTMRTNCEVPGQVLQATREDGRATLFGRFLRRSSLDELPQLWNVLIGNMSLVGPRPHAIEHDAFYREKISRYSLRHKFKPGLTGWAQVNGYRGETDCLEKMEARIDHDLYYIQNWSFWMDISILCLTFTKGFVGKNAY